MSTTPDPDLRSHTLSLAQQDITRRCEEKVHQAIHQKGIIGFDEYMQLVLHDSEVGYYCQGDEIFGKQGDFTTVPETSIHLAFCMAHACASLIRDDDKRIILDMGAGTGKFACDILKFLSDWGKLPRRYYIYESSEALRIKQYGLLKRELPAYIDQVEWLDNLTDFIFSRVSGHISGDHDGEADEATSGKLETAIIIANEVLDALPVKCFEAGSQKIHERVVTLDQENNLKWSLREPTEKFSIALDNLVSTLNEPLATGYQSEVNLNIAPTLASWANCCEQCVMFLVDYGQPCQEYYHPQRHMGTLRSYFKHQVSEDVFTHLGLQDITADVDFSSVAKTAQQLKMDVLSYSSQRNFMLANNLLDWQPSAVNEIERLAQIAQLKQLTLGSAISERFQVMVLGKGIHYDADRFTMRDMRARL